MKITVEEFTKAHSANLRAFMESPTGRDLIDVMKYLRPGLHPQAQMHMDLEVKGARRGYELYEEKLLELAYPNMSTKIAIKQNYGVSDRITETSKK